MPSDLRTFIALLEDKHQLLRISAEVDPLLEIAAITDRVCKQTGGGPALLFENPQNQDFSVATNLFGSYVRSSLALDLGNVSSLSTRTVSLLEQISDLDVKTLDRQISGLKAFTAFTPVTAPPLWLDSQTEPDLDRFPFLQNWSDDGLARGFHRYITLGQVFTSLPDESSPNCGLYRAQIIGSRQLAIQWKEGSGAARHLSYYRNASKPMPVAIALGGEPALTFSAMMPLPGDLDEVTFAGFLRDAPLTMSACKSIPLQAPSGAEVVIEGYVVPDTQFTEGPFGNHSGFYSPPAAAACMNISSISFRSNAIVPSTIVGPPPMEDCWMFKIWEQVLLEILKKIVPEITGIHTPLAWSFHQSHIISLESPRPGMIREIASTLWELPWFSISRIIIFVSATDSPENEAEISWRCINLIDMAHDIITDNTRSRIVLDATGCNTVKKHIQRDEKTASLVDARWKEYGFA